MHDFSFAAMAVALALIAAGVTSRIPLRPSLLLYTAGAALLVVSYAVSMEMRAPALVARIIDPAALLLLLAVTLWALLRRRRAGG